MLATSVAALALLAAGCGGGKTLPSVANLGTATSNNSSGGSSSLRFPPDIGGFGASISTQVGAGAAGIKYTDCMRSYRVPNFPDPDATGTLTITVSPSLNPTSPVFQKAEADCQHLLPPGKTLSQAQQQKVKQGALAFAECMRSHGVPHYPDPTFSNGGISQGYGVKGGVDPNSPIFQAPQKACQSNRRPS